MEDSSDVEMTEMVLETLLNLMSSAGKYSRHLKT